MTQPAPVAKTHRRVKLVRSIVLSGEHAEAGSVHDVPVALAQRLVGEGSAEHVQSQDAPKSVTGVTPPSADQTTTRISDGPAEEGEDEEADLAGESKHKGKGKK
jgi:hypothetical protein